MKTEFYFILLLAVPCAILLGKLFCNPFKYPCLHKVFDVSGKRNVQISDYIDEYLIQNGLEEFTEHHLFILNWKTQSEEKINKSFLKLIRRKQYEYSLSNNDEFSFDCYRLQTRYKQTNYVKTAYKAEVLADTFSCDYDYIKDRYEQLKQIDFSCTLRKYNSKSQRNLMSPNLRKEIMERDNYTCQICGKYMPDEVGLHIDHIIPISKGGKSIPSNLQVLCSKCNGKKSNK